MRLPAALLVAFAVLIAPAAAQEPTPTPTPTPTPAPELSDAERDVYRDYRRDGVIEACDHKKKTLKQVLEELPPEADLDTPDLRPALEAGIEQHRDGDCHRGPRADDGPGAGRPGRLRRGRPAARRRRRRWRRHTDAPRRRGRRA